MNIFSITSRPRRTTLFPYTTLFRSDDDVAAGPGAFQLLPQLGGQREVPDPGAQLDRKSTRLNSSHSSISYAVFCLKKKNGVDTCIHPNGMTETPNNSITSQSIKI